MLDIKFKPDGYNIGINCGEAAGQSVFHLHVHFIPRYIGDIDNPRGGVRGSYTFPANLLEILPRAIIYRVDWDGERKFV